MRKKKRERDDTEKMWRKEIDTEAQKEEWDVKNQWSAQKTVKGERERDKLTVNVQKKTRKGSQKETEREKLFKPNLLWSS